MSAATTLAPSAQNILAMAAPIPDPAPVMTATFPASLSLMVIPSRANVRPMGTPLDNVNGSVTLDRAYASKMFGTGLVREKPGNERAEPAEPVGSCECLVRFDRMPLDHEQILRGRLHAAGERYFRAAACFAQARRGGGELHFELRLLARCNRQFRTLDDHPYPLVPRPAAIQLRAALKTRYTISEQTVVFNLRTSKVTP